MNSSLGCCGAVASCRCRGRAEGGKSKAGLQKQTVGIAASVLEAFRMWYTGSLGKVTE